MADQSKVHEYLYAAVVYSSPGRFIGFQSRAIFIFEQSHRRRAAFEQRAARLLVAAVRVVYIPIYMHRQCRACDVAGSYPTHVFFYRRFDGENVRMCACALLDQVPARERVWVYVYTWCSRLYMGALPVYIPESNTALCLLWKITFIDARVGLPLKSLRNKFPQRVFEIQAHFPFVHDAHYYYDSRAIYNLARFIEKCFVHIYTHALYQTLTTLFTELRLICRASLHRNAAA